MNKNINAKKIIKDYKFSMYTKMFVMDNVECKNGKKRHACFEFDKENEPKENGFVYLWLEINKGSEDIVYIGKAGNRMIDRCKQHIGGFKGTSKSKKGMLNSEMICKGIKSGNKYHVYHRKSETKKILGENVCMYSAEEEALIKKVNPKWNFKPKK